MWPCPLLCCAVASASLILICIAQAGDNMANWQPWQGHKDIPARRLGHPTFRSFSPPATAIRQRHLHGCLVSLKVPLCCLPLDVLFVLSRPFHSVPIPVGNGQDVGRKNLYYEM